MLTYMPDIAMGDRNADQNNQAGWSQKSTDAMGDAVGNLFTAAVVFCVGGYFIHGSS
ncbi:MAG: hypothetical protein R6V33_03920 [Pelovirga sp.]